MNAQQIVIKPNKDNFFEPSLMKQYLNHSLENKVKFDKFFYNTFF